MSFDCMLPFVKEVYRLIGRGELDECAALLVSLIKKHPATPMHCVLDCNFDHFLPEYSDWLFAGCNKLELLDSSVAISTSMGEFEINYQDWTADATVHENYNDPANAYEWLCNSDCRGICPWFHFTGMDPLTEAFALDMQYDDRDPNAEPPYTKELFTAACYLVFTYFLRLNRLTHQRARHIDHGLARVHLFCDYGDCFYHSPPQTAVR